MAALALQIVLLVAAVLILDRLLIMPLVRVLVPDREDAADDLLLDAKDPDRGPDRVLDPALLQEEDRIKIWIGREIFRLFVL